MQALSTPLICAKLLCLALLSAGSPLTLAVTADSADRQPGASLAATTATKMVNATLEARLENGELHTSIGVIKPGPQVEIEDRRPVDDWYNAPAQANISLIYEQDRLVRAIIY